MYIAQRVHQNVCLEASSLDTSRLLVEGRPAPDLSEGEVVLIPYADNLNVAGTDQQRVQQVKEESLPGYDIMASESMKRQRPLP